MTRIQDDRVRARWNAHLLVTLAVLLACALAPAPSRAQSEATASPETAAHATAPASATPADAPPADLRDLEAWLDYRVRHHIASLPQEARLYYRRGLVAHEAGAGDQAVRYLRGAAELDPTFVAPHLTLASWTLLSEPGQALVQYANVIELARRNFTLQHALLANVLYLGLQSIFLGLFAAAFVLAVVHAREIHHVVHERLSGWLRADTSRWWAWAVVVLPYFAGLGPVLPTLFILGWLWHELRPRERFVFVDVDGRMSPCCHTIDSLGSPLTNLEDFRRLPLLFASARAAVRPRACDDCMSTETSAKFERT